uniref:Secreted protein n=1 Tax=Oryza meridionalis TaxID=40149 RepID=A0A0E0C9B0_9ORYZ
MIATTGTITAMSNVAVFFLALSAEAVAIRTSEYTSNALMSGGGSCDVGCLRKVKVEFTLRKNRPFWYMLSTWKGDGEKLANSSSPSL